MRKVISVFFVLVFALEFPLMAGVASDKSVYVGGTATIKAGIESVLNLSDDKIVSFTDWKVPYDKITALSYGQHAGRRVGATVALGVTTLGVGALPMLLSKKRRHYLTIEYTDDGGKSQAAIFEVGKDAIRTDLKTLEVRSGKKVEYEDEEARKSGNK
jgi:hypothetical protein